MNRRQETELTAIAWDAMERFGFYPEFPRSVLREVEAIKPKLGTEGEEAHDLTSLLWSSIDNWDSMDLDQIEYCEEGTDGEIHVKVAIADVDSYVPKRSQADQYAAHNGTSVYTGIVTFPMLPDHLSKGITSLLPGQDCRAVVIEYTILPDGSTRHGSLYRAIVANKAKLIYEEVGEWLEGTRDIPESVRDVPALEEQIRLQHEGAQRLRQYRMKHGALDLQTIEAEPVMEEGRVKDLVVQRQDLARQVIEEFMVAANQTTVAYLEAAGLPMIERVVVTPKYWDEIVDTAGEYGWKLPKHPDAKSLSLFLDSEHERDPDTFPDRSLTIVKLMGPGEYIARDPKREPVGHFALAVTDYTHSTAPNRRYTDLIIQRLVKSAIAGDHCPYTIEDLEDESAWLSDREKGSKKVERFMRKAAAAMLLEDRIGETFEAFVTGASERGTYVRLIQPPVEGRIMRGEKCLKVGHKVTVRLIHTDPEKGFVDFECMGMRPGIRRFS